MQKDNRTRTKKPRANQKNQSASQDRLRTQKREEGIAIFVIALVFALATFALGIAFEKKRVERAKSLDLSRFDKIEEILLKSEYVAPKFD